ncbi:hypothetical protein [Nocardioides sp.]|uniref:YncE family protein n=1 Tax=Nocardioides sp. TaxID=35761 RepID=UPI003D0A7C2F
MSTELKRTSLLALLSAGCLAATVALTSPAGAQVAGDATAETAWHVDGPVFATVIVGDTLIVGGDFDRAVSPTGATLRRDNLAAFSVSSGKPLVNWQTSAPGRVRAMVTDGSSVWVSGAFCVGRSKSNRGRTAVIKLNGTTGRVDNSFRAAADGVVRALALRQDSLYMGGSFEKVNDKYWRSNVAKINAANGAFDESFRARTDGAVRGIVTSPVDREVYLAGSFYEVNGEEHRAVAAVDGRSGVVRDTLFRPVATTLGLDISPDGRLLYAATGGEINGASAYDTATGHRIFRKKVDGDVQAVRYHDGTLYFGFHKGYLGRTTVKLLAADAYNGSIDPDFSPRITGYWGIHAIAASDTAVVAGGNVKSVSGVATQGFAIFDNDLAPSREYVGGVTPWRYLDQGARPDGWESPTFDDSTWSSGRPSFGYGDGDERTLITSGPAVNEWYPTSYFRTTFEVGALPSALTLKLAADDGAVIYVNGVEVARDNMPEGAVGNATRATTYRSAGAEELLRRFSIDPSVLQLGTNTIAVEVHQATGGRSDLTFDARLSGTLTP